jgi:hypothetical protein
MSASERVAPAHDIILRLTQNSGGVLAIMS